MTINLDLELGCLIVAIFSGLGMWGLWSIGQPTKRLAESVRDIEHWMAQHILTTQAETEARAALALALAVATEKIQNMNAEIGHLRDKLDRLNGGSEIKGRVDELDRRVDGIATDTRARLVRLEAKG